jgi:hypothetical protein
MRDPVWQAEGVADDGDSWGKTTARTQGLAMRKEKGNGGAKWWLASGERRAVSYLAHGKE